MSEQLPLHDYDELPLETVRHRVRSLQRTQVQQLVDHERAHANRVLMLEILTNRIDELDAGAIPSQGSQEEMPEVRGHQPSGSPVTPGGPRGKGRPAKHGTISETGKGMEHDE